jgi:hypothetical protein
LLFIPGSWGAVPGEGGTINDLVSFGGAWAASTGEAAGHCLLCPFPSFAVSSENVAVAIGATDFCGVSSCFVMLWSLPLYARARAAEAAGQWVAVWFSPRVNPRRCSIWWWWCVTWLGPCIPGSWGAVPEEGGTINDLVSFGGLLCGSAHV